MDAICDVVSNSLMALQEQQEEVIKKCIAADPRYGPVWQNVSKGVRNTEKNTPEILQMVADLLE